MFRLFLLSLVFIGVYAFAEPKFPELTGRVVDEAGLLSKAQEHSLADMSGTIERDSTVQVVVVTLKSLDGYDIAEYGYQLARYWKVGQRDEDNGILIMIAPKDRKVRIEIGYGLEAFITDAEAYEMIQSKMLPRFKEKNVYGGIRDTIDAIGTIVSKEYQHDYGAYKPIRMSAFYIAAIASIPFLVMAFWAGSYFFSRQVNIAIRVIASVLVGGFAGFLVWAFSHIMIISGIVALIVAIIAYYSDQNSDYGSILSDMADSGGNIGSGDSFEIFSGGGGDFGGAGASADIGSVLDGLGSL
jgi:uncharacterized protein